MSEARFCNGADYQRVVCDALNGDRCMGTFQCGDAQDDGDVMQGYNERKVLVAENAALRQQVADANQAFIDKDMGCYVASQPLSDAVKTLIALLQDKMDVASRQSDSIVRLTEDLRLNAHMLAQQTDAARDAETREMEAKRQVAECKAELVRLRAVEADLKGYADKGWIVVALDLTEADSMRLLDHPEEIKEFCIQYNNQSEGGCPWTDSLSFAILRRPTREAKSR